MPRRAPARNARAVWLDRRLAASPGAGDDGSLGLEREHDGDVLSPLAAHFRYLAPGVRLAVRAADLPWVAALFPGELVLVHKSAGRVEDAAHLQVAGALDGHYGRAAADELGAMVANGQTHFALWAPTARASLCRYATSSSPAVAREPLVLDRSSGIWSAVRQADLCGSYIPLPR